MDIRRCFAAALALVGIAPLAADAGCHVPLPIAALQRLDEQIDSDPTTVDGDLQRRIAALGTTVSLEAAELYVLSADALGAQDDNVGVRRMGAEAHRRLARLPDSPMKRSIDLRLQIVEADAPLTPQDMADSVDGLTQVATGLGADSIEAACLMIVRSRLNSQLLRDEEATADALRAYRITRTLRDDSARGDAAYQLAMTYQRAGLYDEARPMAEEAVSITRARQQTALLSNALYIEGTILEATHQYDAALAALGQARALNQAQGQAIDVAFDDHHICAIQVALQQIDAASATCRRAEIGLAAAGRADLLSKVEGSLAQLDLLQRRPAAALERLNRVLNQAPDQVPAATLPLLYQYRSEALSRLGRLPAALRDSREAQRLIVADDATRRTVAAARLKERTQTDLVQLDRDALDGQIQRERSAAGERATTFQRRLALAALATLVSLLMASVLWSRARQERALRRAAETLEAQAHILSTVHEGVMLVDAQGGIRYANAALATLLGRPAVDLEHSTAEGLGIPLAALQSHSTGALGGLPAGAHEVHLTGAGGQPLIVLLTVSAVTLAGAPLRVCVLLDVTELRRLEHSVLVDASGERHRLSQDVHEGIAQDLSGIALLLSAVVGRTPTDAGTLRALVGHVNELLQRARTLAGQLAPMQLAGGSFPQAVCRLTEHLARSRGIEVDCECHIADLCLIPTQADQLYRIAQGCLQLAAADAGLEAMVVEIRHTDSMLSLNVTSQGIVRPEIPEESTTWGTVAYLARVIGGTAHIDSLPTGRRRRILVPLSHILSPTAA